MTGSKIRIKKICEYCGMEFYAQKLTTRFCSKTCNGASYKERKRGEQITRSLSINFNTESISRSNGSDYMSVAETAMMLGVKRMTIYNLIYRGKLRASRLSSRLTIIRKIDVENMLLSNGYTKNSKPKKRAITEFYKTSEIKDKFGVSESYIYSIAKKKNLPKVFYRGMTLWSKQHCDKYFAKNIENNNIAEWYSVSEMMERFNMTLSAVYSFVSKLNIPKKKIKREVFYSKQHIDIAKGIAAPQVPKYITMKEAISLFEMTRDQIYRYAKKANVSKHMEGRIVVMNRGELEKALAPPII